MAEQLIRSMAAKFEPAKFKDQHRGRVEALLKRKAQGKPIEVPAAPKASQVVDLARALEQSLATASRRSPRPARARRRAPVRARRGV